MRLIGLVFSVAGAFFAFAVGGWLAARIPNHPLRKRRPAWRDRLASALPCCSSSLPSAWPDNSALVRMALRRSGLGRRGPSGGPEIAKMMRNTAVASVVPCSRIDRVGHRGLMASGEPQTLTHYRSREIVSDASRPRSAHIEGDRSWHSSCLVLGVPFTCPLSSSCSASAAESVGGAGAAMRPAPPDPSSREMGRLRFMAKFLVVEDPGHRVGLALWLEIVAIRSRLRVTA